MDRLRGNLHTHTTASDGDSPPEAVARWYRDAGYDFLVISDHNVRVAVDELQAGLDAEGGRRLLLIPGEELTEWLPTGERILALHVNGIHTTRQIGSPGGATAVEVLQRMIDAVAADGGLPSLNHPNFWRSVTVGDMLSLERLTHFEVFNGHPLTFSGGGEGLPSMETVWDALLTAGRRVFGVAVDDAHDFTAWGPERSNPGRGWVEVWAPADGRAPEDRRAIVDALRAGRFYASTGARLERVGADGGRLSLEVAAPGPARTVFVAQGGVVVGESEALTPSHPLGDHRYLRARVTTPEGVAWVQPVFALDA